MPDPTRIDYAELERIVKEATPGPWRAGRSDMVSYTMLAGEDGGPWKHVYWNDPEPEMRGSQAIPSAVARAYGREASEAIATARLIALAPQLASELLDRQRWVPVSTRAPETDELMIVSDKYGRRFPARYEMGDWKTFLGDDIPIGYEVTHWQPLPPAPSVEGERKG